MKVVSNKTHVTIDNVNTQSFGLVFDSQMVDILSNQLYQDSILAIVRELSTNALDSQVENGLGDKPFDVHLPTWADNTFWIRDYGTGMSPDKVENVYKNYGASDRRDSNDFCGCKGLGSKTPFCYYTQSFTVDNWYDGIHYQYACFLDEDGMPQLALMTEEPSDEPLGVKVTLPVNKHDEYDFSEAARKVYAFFDVVPNMFGKSVEITKPKYTIERGNWKYDQDDGYGDMKVVMGNVAYTIKPDALGELTPAQTRVANKAFHVYVPIGEVGVSASREGLHYTNRTKTKVRNYINTIIKEFETQVQDEIDKCATLWDARLKYCEFIRESKMSFFDADKLTYNGEKVEYDDDIDISQMIKDEKISAKQFIGSSWKKSEKTVLRNVSPSKNPLFYENDLKIGGFVRSHYVADDQQRTIYLITFKVPGARQEFMELVGITEDHMNKISDIPSPNIGKKNSFRYNSLTQVQEFLPSYRETKRSYWKNAEIDLDEGGIYVEFNRFKYKTSNDKYHRPPMDLTYIFKKIKNAGIKVPTVYGIKTRDMDAVKKNSDWKDFYVWLIEKIKAKAKTKDFYSPIAYSSALHNIEPRWKDGRLPINWIHKLAKHFNNNPITQFSEAIVDATEKSKDYKLCQHFEDLRLYMGLKSTSNKVKVSLTDYEKAVYDTYPLLKMFNMDRLSLSDIPAIVAYIEQIDQEKENEF